MIHNGQRIEWQQSFRLDVPINPDLMLTAEVWAHQQEGKQIIWHWNVREIDRGVRGAVLHFGTAENPVYAKGLAERWMADHIDARGRKGDAAA